jgi:5-bromo-4-chloroindolyl phosphate hydrolysis protein
MRPTTGDWIHLREQAHRRERRRRLFWQGVGVVVMVLGAILTILIGWALTVFVLVTFS